MINFCTLGGLSIKELLKRTARESWDDEVFGQSARLAFYHFLALFPALVLTATILGRFGAPGADFLHTLQSSLSMILPPRASETVTDFINEMARGAARRTLWFALAGSAWAAFNGTWAVMSGLNAAYEVQEDRPWWMSTLTAAGLTLTLAILVATSLVVLFYGRELAQNLLERAGLPANPELAWQLIHWPILAGLLLVAFAILYRFAPNLRDRQLRWSTPGAVIAMLLWLGASGLFRAYVSFEQTRYRQVYGSTGAVAILLLWFYFTGVAILIGGEANSEIENAAAQHGHPDQGPPGKHRRSGVAPPRG